MVRVCTRRADFNREKLGANIFRLPPLRFTAMVNCGDILPSERTYVLTRGAKRKEKAGAADSPSVRATISFPRELYTTLEDIARQKKVSLAWVVREAADQYIADKWPLLVKLKEK